MLHTITLRVSTREGETQKDRLANSDREKGTQTPATKDGHRPLPAQLRHAHSLVHTHFPNSDTPLRERQTLPNYTKHRYTQNTNIHSTKF